MAESPPELQLELEKLERKHAENPEGRYFVPLANAYRKVGKVETAEGLLREGLRRHPDYLSAHIVLGRCLADRGATVEAATEFRYVLSLDPQNLIALRTLGELAASDGKPEEAERWFRELLDIDPMNEEARLALESLEPATPLVEPEAFEEATSWWERPVQVEGPPPAHVQGSVEQDPPPTPRGADFGASWLRDPSAKEADRQPTAQSPPAGPAPAPAQPDEVVPEYEDEDEMQHADDEPDVLESSELVTETIAELFARQGLHARAAEVYRELIRRRGQDPALQRRLAEIEATLAAASAPAPTPAVEREPPLLPDPLLPEPLIPEPELIRQPQPEPEPELLRDAEPDREPEEVQPLAGLVAPFGQELWSDPTPAAAPEPEPASEPEAVTPPWRGFEDAFAASFTDGFDLLDAVTVPPPAPLAEPEPPLPWLLDAAATEDAASSSGTTIGALLAELAAWSPAPPAPSVANARPQTVAPPAPAAEPRMEPRIEEAPAAPVQPPEPEGSGTKPASDELFPWELPAPEEEVTPLSAFAPEPAAAAAESGFSLEELFGSPPPAPALEPEPLSTPAPAPPAAPAAEPEPAPAARVEPSRAEEDDDLESFQAWLRSLKR